MRSLSKEETVEKGLCVDDGLCAMCGLCAGVCPTGNIATVFRDNEPQLDFGSRCNDCGLCYQACPGKDVPLRDLDKLVFGRERDPERDLLGLFKGCYQSYAIDSEIRATSAGGGTVSALLIYALERGIISGATVASMDKEVPWRVRPAMATNRKEVLAGGGTKSVVVPLQSALREASAAKGKIGCVGVPCHVHGLRKLQQRFPKNPLSRSLSFVIGVFCGMNGPYRRIDYYLQEQFALHLDEIGSIRYRSHSRPWKTEMTKKNGERIECGWYNRDMRLFARERCTLCLDWVADLADVSVGDYWGAEEAGDGRGSNTLFIRTKVGDDLVRGAVEAGYLKIRPVSPGPLLLTTGFRQKKQFNLHKYLACQKYGWPAPDFQYPVAMTPPVDRRGAPYNYSSLSANERSNLLEERGTSSLWFD